MNNVYIKFSNNWVTFGNTSVRGIVFIQDRKIVGNKLASLISEIPAKELSETLTNVNGFFSAVCVGESAGWMSVDKIRSYPVFYGQKDGKLFISDDARWVKEQVQNTKFDPIAKAEFLLTGFVTGSDTLYPDIKQLQAGEFIHFNELIDGTIKLRPVRYYSYIHKDSYQDSEKVLLQKFDKVMVNTFNRLVEVADGRTMVVPLSGGYDSRLIVMMLKRLGYKNIVTFTYGKKGNKEGEISRTVANALELPWHFIEFTPDVWKKNVASEEWKNYFCMAGNLCSLPHIQDFIAIRELKKILHSDLFFIPGISADLNTGGFISKYPKIYCDDSTVKELNKLIVDYSYSLFNGYQSLKSSDIIKKRIHESLQEKYETGNEGSAFEAWVATEKVAKFIQNSVRAYEFWGYQWWVPFWDSEFVDFWFKVEPEYRNEQYLYKKYIKKLTVELGGLGLVEPLHRDGTNIELKKSLIKYFAKKILTNDLKTKLLLLINHKKHPLQWYSIFDKKTIFIKTIRGATCINSFFVEDYLNSVKSIK